MTILVTRAFASGKNPSIEPAMQAIKMVSRTPARTTRLSSMISAPFEIAGLPRSSSGRPAKATRSSSFSKRVFVRSLINKLPDSRDLLDVVFGIFPGDFLQLIVGGLYWTPSDVGRFLRHAQIRPRRCAATKTCRTRSECVQYRSSVSNSWHATGRPERRARPLSFKSQDFPKHPNPGPRHDGRLERSPPPRGSSLYGRRSGAIQNFISFVGFLAPITAPTSLVSSGAKTTIR